ncbi:protein TIFY 10a-like [Lycium ferocissimum]|uniref:protein TIFY 10a-like n=1 Tax=Lycium ferocissimum TaxID=112874 RepID=UPI002815B6D1|nr:protein TIFY 10a-like [Lycium ferocissimum]
MTGTFSELSAVYPIFVWHVAKLEKAQMTIFYAGKVIVFNEFPADKVKEIMILASKKSNSNNVSYAIFPPKPIESASQIFKNTLIQECSQSQSLLKTHEYYCPVDLPIARKASLTRFLGKRKDRLTANAPYPIRGQYNQKAPSKLEESNTWLGLGQLKSDN